MLRFGNTTGFGNDTKITDAETGDDITQILAIESASFKIEARQPVECRVKLAFIAIDLVPGKTVFETKHPVTGEYLPVAAIEFSDGTRVEIAEDGTPTVISN
ncbi:hypothetical protein [Mesorhizobium sp. 128a]